MVQHVHAGFAGRIARDLVPEPDGVLIGGIARPRAADDGDGDPRVASGTDDQSFGLRPAEDLGQLIADLIAEVLQDVKNLDVAKKVRERVKELTARYPLPY